MKNSRLITILATIIVISCQPRTDEQTIPVNFFENELLSNSETPILNIYYQSDECGEWGGHEEFIEIKKKEGKSFELTHTEYSVNCDSMVNVLYQGATIVRPYRELVKSSKIALSESGKRAILNFSTEMIKTKFNEPVLIHAGVVLSITNQDSTLNISTWGGTDEHYQNLIKELDLNE